MLRRLATLLSLFALTAVLAACGVKEEVVLAGETEGVYLDVGEPPIKYQVQISRQLNPANVEDRAYLTGIPEEESTLEAEEVWFAVFVRVENDGDSAQPTAKEFLIEDTEDNEYEPVELEPDNNYAYRPKTLPAGDRIPPLDSTAEQGTIQGSLLLYKIPRKNLENRPLEFIIKSPQAPQRVGTVDLDI